MLIIFFMESMKWNIAAQINILTYAFSMSQHKQEQLLFVQLKKFYKRYIIIDS